MKQISPLPSQPITNFPIHETLTLEGKGVVVGCDPGPEHSAFALVTTEGNQIYCPWVRYISNAEIFDGSATDFGELFPTPAAAFVYEKTVNHGRVVGAQVFNTCAASGMIRYLARSCGLAQSAVVAVSPSMWRFVTVGFGSAKDSETRETLENGLQIPGIKELINAESKRAKKEYGLTKPCTSHLRDAVGVAAAALLSTVRLGPGGLFSMAEVIWTSKALDGGADEQVR